jgi:5'-nucleotidase
MLLNCRALISLLALALSFAAPARAGDDRLHVVVLHTNDIHGQAITRKATWLKRDPAPMVGGLPRVAAYVNTVRADALTANETVFLVDGGDWYQGTPEGLVDDGKVFTKALALVGYDAMCLGNHDFDHGIPNLLEILNTSKLPAVAANLELKATKKLVEWVPPYRIVERGGLKIAFVGLVSVVTPEITHPDAQMIDFIDPSKALARVKRELHGKVDWIVPVTHIGLETDKALARAHPELMLIVGGHSHTYLKEGEREGTTLIVQSGSKASAVGRVDLWVDPTTKNVLESKAQLVDLDTDPPATRRNLAVDGLCAELESRSAEKMQEVIGELLAPAERAKDLTSGTAGNMIADVLRDYTRADVALMNRGGIRTDMQAGKVTRRDVFEIMPFDNSVVVLKLTGAELTSMVRNAVEGKAHSGIEMSGMIAEVAVDSAGKRALMGIKVGDFKLDAAREYRVAMNSFMADGGDAYIAKVSTGPKRVDDATLIRDVLERYFLTRGKVMPAAENRYVVTKP